MVYSAHALELQIEHTNWKTEDVGKGDEMDAMIVGWRSRYPVEQFIM